MVKHSSTNPEMQQILAGALEITRKAVSEVCEDVRIIEGKRV